MKILIIIIIASVCYSSGYSQDIYLENNFKLVDNVTGDTLCFNDIFKDSLIYENIVQVLGLPDSTTPTIEDELTGRMYADLIYDRLGLRIFDDFSLDLTIVKTMRYRLVLNNECALYIGMELTDLEDCFPDLVAYSQEQGRESIGIGISAFLYGSYVFIDRSVNVDWDANSSKINFIGIWDAP